MGPRSLPLYCANYGNSTNSNQISPELSFTSVHKKANQKVHKRLTFLQCTKPIDRTFYQALKKYKCKPSSGQKLLSNDNCEDYDSRIVTEILGSFDQIISPVREEGSKICSANQSIRCPNKYNIRRRKR